MIHLFELLVFIVQRFLLPGKNVMNERFFSATVMCVEREFGEEDRKLRIVIDSENIKCCRFLIWSRLISFGIVQSVALLQAFVRKKLFNFKAASLL